MPRVHIRAADSLVGGSGCRRFFHYLTNGETWTHYHLSVFILTFFSFAFIHATRKTLSTVKPSLIISWTHNTSSTDPLFPSAQAASEFLAMLDGGFLFAYSLGLFGGGILGDRYDPRIVLSIGMWLSSIMVYIFGYVTEVFHIYSKTFYAFLWISGGFFQSVGWPTEVCIVGNWFGHGSRGAVMGLWSSCASVGNIIGTIISSRMVLLGYQYVFAANSTLLFAFGFVIYFCLVSAPRDVGLPNPAESSDEINRVIEEPASRPKPISFWKAWLLPGVIAYSLAYSCLKLVNYGFFFWLPFYLHNNFGWSETDADSLSAWYDVGGIIAAVLAGAISDHLSSRTPLVVGMLFVSTFALWAYSNSPPSYLVNAVLLAFVGFFVGGPANMISSSISADLGKARELHGSAEALSTVTGIVDGTGSVGAAFGQLLIPSVQAAFGWGAVFYGFIFMIVCTTSCLIPLLYHEILRRRRVRYSSINSEAEEGDSLLRDDQGQNPEGNSD